MAVLLGFLLLVIPAIYIYSFIKPEKFNVRTGKNPNGKYSRMQFTGITALIWFAVVAIVPIFVDTESVTAKSSEPPTVEENQPEQIKAVMPVEEAVTTRQEATLGLTVDEYGNK
ncbi:hypothetical protein [Psychrobacter sanguinis]|uniref:hypothetical protein n=1 Tax=Psychrobacter sanguinis TaxID=861445 RepID=UPI00191AB657|nr:hypothetical protein [Psychrobacter sanguinis]MCC3309448.1 hypothetical protein [Psychrobacter sanguinis]